MTEEQLKLAHELALEEIARLRDKVAALQIDRECFAEASQRYRLHTAQVRVLAQTTNERVMRPVHTPDGQVPKVILTEPDWDNLLALACRQS